MEVLWKFILLIVVQLVSVNPTNTYPFDASKDANTLFKALDRYNTDEDPIINVATQRSLEQRLKIKDRYNFLQDRDLITDLTKILDYNLGPLIVGLFQTKPEFYATTIHQAIENIGTNDQTLVDLSGHIFCCLDDVSVRDISKVYRKTFSKELITDVKEDVSGDSKKLLVALIEEKRQPADDYQKNATRVLSLAKQLVKAGVGIWQGTREAEIIKIFSECSFPELVDVSNAYEQFIKISLEDTIKSETSGNLRELLHKILRYAKDPINHYALILQSALSKKLSWMTGPRIVTQVLVRRDEIDLAEIQERYEQNTYRTLQKDIEKAFSGDYEKTCLKIIRGNK